jgi:hypothetical protein
MKLLKKAQAIKVWEPLVQGFRLDGDELLNHWSWASEILVLYKLSRCSE